MTKLEELKKKHAALKDEIVTESKAFFKEAAAGIFDKYPTVETFSWTQHTPWFNDGETCEFGVYSDCEINGLDEYDNKSKLKEIPSGAFVDTRKLVDSIDEDTMKEMFGDHVKITCSRTGVEVEEHQHD